MSGPPPDLFAALPEQYFTRIVTAAAAARALPGPRLIDLGRGNPDLPPPPVALEALKTELEASRGMHGYPPFQGRAELCEAIAAHYRDVRHAVPFLIQFWLFATPIAYPSSLLPAQWRVLYAVNPMTGVVEGFRWSLLGTSTAPGAMVAVSAITAMVVLIGGAFYFRRMERTFADLV